MATRKVTVEFQLDPEEYGEPDTDEAAKELIELILHGDADLCDYTVLPTLPE